MVIHSLGCISCMHILLVHHMEHIRSHVWICSRLSFFIIWESSLSIWLYFFLLISLRVPQRFALGRKLAHFYSLWKTNWFVKSTLRGQSALILLVGAVTLALITVLISSWIVSHVLAYATYWIYYLFAPSCTPSSFTLDSALFGWDDIASLERWLPNWLFVLPRCRRSNSYLVWSLRPLFICFGFVAKECEWWLHANLEFL